MFFKGRLDPFVDDVLDLAVLFEHIVLVLRHLRLGSRVVDLAGEPITVLAET